ncbi:RNA polymerase sigma factor [Bradyrhizobium japonicum]|uniref:RNA polymerase sigma factor n=1 Tax=Bradyrhizobium japonicum TaxID=375 RepID=UPI00048504D1|nr:sigma-70 family RNA polymerase sigma factor [Bradyrhizobium japonicum]
MANSGETDDPSHLAADIAAPARPTKGAVELTGVPPLAKYKRRSELTDELRRWYALEDAARRDELRHVAAGAKRWTIEALMHAVRQAHASGDRRSYIEAFNAFATRATPLLMRQAVKYDAGEDEDHAQDVLLRIAKEVQAGKAEYAEVNFAHYAMRKAIDAHRHKDSSIESKRERAQPSSANDGDESDAVDPLNEIEDRMASPEVQGLLRHAIGRLEGKFRDILIQRYIARLTYEELAEHYQVDATTISNWVQQALKIAGRQGDNDDED